MPFSHPSLGLSVFFLSFYTGHGLARTGTNNSVSASVVREKKNLNMQHALAAKRKTVSSTGVLFRVAPFLLKRFNARLLHSPAAARPAIRSAAAGQRHARHRGFPLDFGRRRVAPAWRKSLKSYRCLPQSPSFSLEKFALRRRVFRTIPPSGHTPRTPTRQYTRGRRPAPLIPLSTHTA